jgi:hypothetical protein
MLQRLYINGVSAPELGTAFKATNGQGIGDVSVVLCPNTNLCNVHMGYTVK